MRFIRYEKLSNDVFQYSNTVYDFGLRKIVSEREEESNVKKYEDRFETERRKSRGLGWQS